MRRIMMLLGILALLPLLMGAGGSNPGVPSGTKIGGPTFTANVVMDPHELGVTTTAKWATIRIYHEGNTAGALFQVPVFFFFFLGCDLTKTDARFRYTPLITWIPEAVLNELFADLGTGRNPNFEPMITRIDNDACTPDPANPGPLVGGSVPGFLSFQATIRFQVPK